MGQSMTMCQCKCCRLVVEFVAKCNWCYLVAKIETNTGYPLSRQVLSQCQLRHLVTKFATDASSATWWPIIEITPSQGVCISLGPLCHWQFFSWKDQKDNKDNKTIPLHFACLVEGTNIFGVPFIHFHSFVPLISFCLSLSIFLLLSNCFHLSVFIDLFPFICFDFSSFFLSSPPPFSASTHQAWKSKTYHQVIMNIFLSSNCLVITISVNINIT